MRYLILSLLFLSSCSHFLSSCSHQWPVVTVQNDAWDATPPTQEELEQAKADEILKKYNIPPRPAPARNELTTEQKLRLIEAYSRMMPPIQHSVICNTIQGGYPGALATTICN